MFETVIAMRGTIYEKGYGLISQSVMRDKNLSAKAKAIYAYLCSFAGSGDDRIAFPGVQLMMDELGFRSKDTYYKFRKELEAAGYITVEQKTDEQNRFTKCIYYIEAVVKPKEPKKPVNKGNSPCPKNRDTENSYTENQETISISSINISLKNDCMIDGADQSEFNSKNSKNEKEIMDALNTYVPRYCYADNLPLGQDYIAQIYLMLLSDNNFKHRLSAEIVRMAAERYFDRACEVLPGGVVANKFDVTSPVGLFKKCYTEAIKLYKAKHKPSYSV